MAVADPGGVRGVHRILDPPQHGYMYVKHCDKLYCISADISSLRSLLEQRALAFAPSQRAKAAKHRLI